MTWIGCAVLVWCPAASVGTAHPTCCEGWQAGSLPHAVLGTEERNQFRSTSGRGTGERNEFRSTLGHSVSRSESAGWRTVGRMGRFAERTQFGVSIAKAVYYDLDALARTARPPCSSVGTAHPTCFGLVRAAHPTCWAWQAGMPTPRSERLPILPPPSSPHRGSRS